MVLASVPFSQLILDDYERTRRDHDLSILKQTNAILRGPREKYWAVVMDHVLNLKPSNVSSLIHDIEQNTQYLVDSYLDNADYANAIWKGAKVFPIPKSIISRPSYPRFIEELFGHFPLNDDEEQLFRSSHPFTQIMHDSTMRLSTGGMLNEYFQAGTNILKNLCRLDLSKRLPANFRGVYVRAGTDVDLLYALGGKWLIIEQGRDGSPKEEIIEGTEYGRCGIEGGLFDIIQADPVRSSGSFQPMADFHPDVVLAKGPGQSVSYDDLVFFYASNIRRPTLLVSEVPLNNNQLVPLNNLVAIDGLDHLHLESDTSPPMGQTAYPFTSWILYVLHPIGDNQQNNLRKGKDIIRDTFS